MKGLTAAVGVAVCCSALLAGCAGLGSGHRGKAEFEFNCATCHGDDGKGNGREAASLAVKPADLTVLAKNNGGEFPAGRVRAVIDGRLDVAGHGSREMPVWGMAFQVVPPSQPLEPSEPPFGFREEKVQDRIEALVDYLRGLQEQ